MRSMSRTRSGGTRRRAQRVTVDLSTWMPRARSESRNPRSRSRDLRSVAMIEDKLRNSQQIVNTCSAHLANDRSCAIRYYSRMSSDIQKIHPSKQPKRPHHIADWMEKFGLKAVDVSTEIGVDKSVVSRWLSGSTPGEQNQERLAALFHIDRESLFRHPDDDWLAKFFSNRSREEMERIKATLEAAFPRKQTG